MTADTLLELITQFLVLAICVVVTVEAMKRPHRANIDIALLFATFTAIVGLARLLNGGMSTVELTRVASMLLLVTPYLQMRLVADFSHVRPWLVGVALAGAVASEVSLVLVSEAQRPAWLTGAYVLYFVGFQLVVGVAFVREARLAATGVTRRRLRALAWASALLGMNIMLSAVVPLLPGYQTALTVLMHLFGLGCTIAYFMGFAPPRMLRLAWQAPEVRSFLAKAAQRTHLNNTSSMIKEIEAGAALATGATRAVIALWDESKNVLRYKTPAGGEATQEAPAGQFLSGRAFLTQRAVFSANPARDDPDNAQAYAEGGAAAVLAAPITAGSRRLGVLTVYSERAPMFGDDDLGLVSLLADQAALILQCRVLIEQEAEVQARQEVTRLKDDFLSSAAHKLKSPLTAMILTAENTLKKARKSPDAPADTRALERMASSSQRLQAQVLELLDSSDVERGRLVGKREPVDLLSIVRDVCVHQKPDDVPRLVVEGAQPVEGAFDEKRMRQLFGNLVENALKFSPDGGQVTVKVHSDGKMARASVTDCGIGIPHEDLPHVFERFRRASNVNDRTFAGMGLGLHICKGIVSQHGGDISAASDDGKGTTFTVDLPLEPT